MNDTEKICEGIVCCVLTHRCPDCPYFKEVGCRSRLSAEAVTLLKHEALQGPKRKPEE